MFYLKHRLTASRNQSLPLPRPRTIGLPQANNDTQDREKEDLLIRSWFYAKNGDTILMSE